MDSSSINKGTFILKYGNYTLSGSVNYSDSTAGFIPVRNLRNNSNYTGVITRGVKDISGNTLQENYVWNFATRDTIAPEIVLVSPDNGASRIPINTIITAVFSEPLDSTSINNNTFYIESGLEGRGQNAEGRINFNNRIVTFTPASPLETNTTYTVTITTGVKDQTGNMLAQDYIWRFTTPDIIAPQILSTNPEDGEKEIIPGANITIRFSEYMDTTTINSETFILRDDNDDLIRGTFNYTDTTIIFIPFSDLVKGKSYSATLRSNIKDLSGNSLQGDYTWNFYTIPGWNKMVCGQMHSIGILSDSSLWTFGRNTEGQLGDGTTVWRYFPTRIGKDKWINISGGGSHTIALLGDSTLFCWGYNESGQLGDGTTSYRYSPTKIGTNKWLKVSGGRYHTMAIRKDSTLFGWGDNGYGQLGDGTWTGRYSPKQIGIGRDWIKISGSGNHTAGIKANGTLWTWGYNFDGQLVDGTTINKNIPEQIGTDNNWADVSCGFHTAAIKGDGTLWTFGWNKYGQLGDGTTINRNIPIQVGSDGNWVKAAAGEAHTAAIKSNGTLWAWGLNDNGQLGDGTKINKNIPVQLGIDNDWAEVSCGKGYTLALKKDNTLWAFGNNSYGQIGDGTTIGRTVPIEIKYDNIPPVIKAISPAQNGENVSVDSIIKVEFFEEMDEQSINTNTFYSESSSESGRLMAEGRIDYNNKIAVFTPANPLELNRMYKAVLTTGIKDIAGNNMGINFVWTFTTHRTLPQVISTYPVNGEKGLPVNISATAVFSERIDTTSINMNTFILKDIKNNIVPGSFIFTDTTATFIPDPALKETMIYIAEVKRDVKAQTGNNLFNDYIWNFSIKGYEWIKTASGTSHTIAIKSNGALFTWGANNFGQ
ncbi:Ig-like domain-containing protein, partial [Candidatus Desantisbacteria bacterium]|nr:Ig-like domain-containing protein [Candidatus Desantisbacteria bacterium]